MPSKNSINRPKLTANVAHRTARANRRRSERERAGMFRVGREMRVVGDMKALTSVTTRKRLIRLQRRLRYAQLRSPKPHLALAQLQLAKKGKATKEKPVDTRQVMEKSLQSTGFGIQRPQGNGTTLGGAYFP